MAKIQESLGCLGELGALLGDHNEGTLDLIGAVLHGVLGWGVTPLTATAFTVSSTADREA